MRLALFLALITLFLSTSAFAQGMGIEDRVEALETTDVVQDAAVQANTDAIAALSSAGAPTHRFEDSLGVPVGDFEENGNAVFVRPNGKRIVVAIHEDGFSFNAFGTVTPLFVWYVSSVCSGDGLVKIADVLAHNPSSRDLTLVRATLQNRVWALTDDVFPETLLAARTVTFSSAPCTADGDSTRMLGGFVAEEVTSLFQGFTPPFSRVPLP